MQKFIKPIIMTLVLMGTLLTAALADGGAPPILCFPGQCNFNQQAGAR